MLKNARNWIQNNQDNIALGVIVAASTVLTGLVVKLAYDTDKFKRERDEARRVADFMLDANLGGYMATMDEQGQVSFVNMVPQE